ncbi:hypothetical protein VitviT2T_011146 [Vitis vinifera]|uniref:Protein kinase domain-containing protein n=2 Tax=Vitis vinifera TaxID=29760 RepID=A0ABY9CAY4_VITVI|nr:hypothetical protein VitviT2T_011146 [Vitis vinifera]
MGCVQTRPSVYSPSEGLVKLKLQNGYAKRGYGGRPIRHKPPEKLDGKSAGTLVDGGGGGGGGEEMVGREDENKLNGGGGNVSQKITVKRIGGDELVDGWPKWLVDNIHRDALVGLVPKSVDSYEKLAKVGQGTYSNVYKARDRETRKIVALKKVRFDTSEAESVKFMAREIMILQKLDHPNIIKLEGLATSRMQYSLYLVFDFMPTDLTRVISRPNGRLTEPQVKFYMQQLLAGVQHCHERGILHRDLKGSNLLIDKNGVLKIADFGLANFLDPKPKKPLTSRVVTLWYRAPELLLGSTDYGVGIDLWSVGCLLAEMFTGRPIMPGRTEVEQLHRIFKLCGSPSEDYWKKLRLPTSFRPPQQYKPSFQDAFRDFPSSSFALLTSLLALDPAFRGSAATALESGFFTSSPLPCDLSGLPVVVYKEADEPSQANKRKNRHRTSRSRQQSRTHNEGRRKKDPTAEEAKGDSGTSSQEEKSTDPTSQETGNSPSSRSSSSKPMKQEGQLPLSLSPALQSHGKRAPKTEGHPNATKNIKNLPILYNSFQTDSSNTSQDEGPRLTFNYRSLSTLDFRTLDTAKIAKLFAPDKDS